MNELESFHAWPLVVVVIPWCPRDVMPFFLHLWNNDRANENGAEDSARKEEIFQKGRMFCIPHSDVLGMEDSVVILTRS